MNKESVEYYRQILKEFDQHSSGYQKPGGATLLKRHRQKAVKIFKKLQAQATANPKDMVAANKAYRAQQLARKLGVMVGKAGSVGDPVEGEKGNQPVVFTRSGGYNPNKTPITSGIGALLTGLPNPDVSRASVASAEASLRNLSPTARNRRAAPPEKPSKLKTIPNIDTKSTLGARIMARLTNRATSGGTPARPVSVK